MEDEERRPLLEGRNEGSSTFDPTSSTNGQTVPRHDEVRVFQKFVSEL